MRLRSPKTHMMRDMLLRTLRIRRGFGICRLCISLLNQCAFTLTESVRISVVLFGECNRYSLAGLKQRVVRGDLRARAAWSSTARLLRSLSRIHHSCSKRKNLVSDALGCTVKD